MKIWETMLFGLKKNLMARVIGKRNRLNPFDFQRAEDYTLAGVDDPLVNNSYYFSAHDGALSFFARLGKRIDVEETWFVIWLDGKIYSLKQETFPAGASPVRIEKSEGNWTISYQGLLNDRDDVCFQATFRARHKALDFTSDMPAARMATGLANEKWNRALFAQLQTISGQCHYEQEGTLEGQLVLNGKAIGFQLPCVRDHSFGKRDWSYMNNHLWLMAVSASGQFNYSLVSYPAMTVLEVGNYRDGAGQHFMQQADLDFLRIDQGIVPGELSFRMKLDNQQTIPVTAKVLTGVTYHFQQGRYILHENIAEFTIDGRECRGILEIGFNSDSNRIFNQRDMRTIRR